jgi:hypothetical protein
MFTAIFWLIQVAARTSSVYIGIRSSNGKCLYLNFPPQWEAWDT